MNPIVHRELIGLLRTRKAVALQFAMAAACAIIVLLRWPTGEVADLNGARSLQMLRVFGYGMLAGVLLLVPAFPAVSFVRERIQGTLQLLLNSPLSPLSIYLGKLIGALGFTAVLLVMTLPAAAACHALGGAITQGGITSLYLILALACLQLSTLALFVSCRARTTDGALRATYSLVLAVCVLPLGPEKVLRGDQGLDVDLAGWFRCLSPIPAVMEALGQADVGAMGLVSGGSVIPSYVALALLSSLLCAFATVVSLRPTLLDLARPAGILTQDRALSERIWRRLFFLVDPQRRSGTMSLWVNPVMVKEFRSRRFGRSHWALRLLAVSAILSLGLSYLAAAGSLGWGPEIIGGALVLLQIALLILFAPSLAAGLISSERESGSWQLLRMTPLSARSILMGKLLSVAWPLLLILCATLPGYIVMMTVDPVQIPRVSQVVVCLALLGVFAVFSSAFLSSLCPSTAIASTSAYLALLAICAGPLLVWLAREAPFSHAAVRSALLVDPVAAALQASATPGFTSYELLPDNWWIMGAASIALLMLLIGRTWELCRPE